MQRPLSAKKVKLAWRTLFALSIVCLITSITAGAPIARIAWTIGVLLFFGGAMLIWYWQRAPQSWFAMGLPVTALILAAGFTNYPLSFVFWGLAGLVYLTGMVWLQSQKRRAASADSGNVADTHGRG
jgi:hypothetical protein